jgi:hypothetical protein
MNRAQFRDAIRLRTGMLSDDQMGTDAHLNSLIDDAIDYVQIEMPSGWPWQQYRGSFSTVAGTESYSFATIDGSNTIMRIGSMRVVLDTTYEVELEPRAFNDLVTMYSSTAQQTPESYAVDGRTVILRPIPNAVYTIKFRAVKAEPTLSGDSSVPLMPEMFHNTIVEQAAYLWYRRTSNDQLAQVAKAELTHLLARAMSYAREAAGPGRIKDVRERTGSSF